MVGSPVALVLAARRRARAQTAAAAAQPRRSRRWTSTASRCSTSARTSSQIDPNWYDTMRVAEAAVVRRPVRRGRRRLRRRPPEPARREDRRRRPRSASSKTQFEFELFGTGVDEGQTTFRLRHAYGELGQFGAGQTWSPFMDPDVFPNSLEYWGPTGMVFFRNVQVRWMPIKGDSQPDARPRAAGRERRPGRLRGPHRAAERQGAVPRCRTSRAPYQLRRQVGLRAGGRHPAPHQVGRRARRPVRPERQRHRLGPELQLEPEARRRPTSSACSSSTARASRTT